MEAPGNIGVRQEDEKRNGIIFGNATGVSVFMKQVLVRGGKVEVHELPVPTASAGSALVRVHCSMISSGTESSFVSEGGVTSYAMKKAKDPLNIEKVKRKLATIGLKGTIDIVRNKLFEFQTPGYSAAGTIIECGDGLQGFRTGDRVACAGVGHASHAEYDVVPQQLLTPVPDGVSFEEAAFVAIGAIAMQGVRQTTPTLGETVVVMGLGLVGQITVQIARAAGCHVIGSDPVAARRELAIRFGADAACAPGELSAVTNEWTAGYGADAVIVCAASKDSVVTQAALDLCRQKGRVIVVGAVGMQLVREPMYMKELDFRLSCSYGPGRYDLGYEEKGLDYPIGYVRWTEGRNMAEFLRMIADKRVDVKPLISVVKPIAQAAEAYKAILDKDSNTIAALIAYGGENEQAAPPPERRLLVKPKNPVTNQVGVAVIGAGGFASAFHLPNTAKMPEARLEAVVDVAGAKAKQAAEKYGARYCTTDYREVLADGRVQAVIIATRHNMHKPLAIAAAEAGKHVFVEKPLAITVPDCEEVCAAVEKAGVLLSVGFNRRFSKFSQQAKALLPRMHGPKMILYRCNAGALPTGHWATDPVEGGGRIVGEGVHFFDFCCWLLGQDPIDIRADRIDANTQMIIPSDNLSVTMRFPDGSLATVVYCAIGHPSISKEYIEIAGGNTTIVIDNFMGIRFGGLPEKNVHQKTEHKGQYELLENFIKAIRGEGELSVTARHGLRATQIAQEALRKCHNP